MDANDLPSVTTDELYVTEVEESFTLLNNIANGTSGRPKHFPKLSTGGSIALYLMDGREFDDGPKKTSRIGSNRFVMGQSRALKVSKINQTKKLISNLNDGSIQLKN